mmetsp:Transcript_74063/g.228905  ORF Transcript_74063/g.228905 Transcript_74063/m.228905 type:complete len:238 (+) Transcript_74063:424-1137(+)
MPCGLRGAARLAETSSSSSSSVAAVRKFPRCVAEVARADVAAGAHVARTRVAVLAALKGVGRGPPPHEVAGGAEACLLEVVAGEAEALGGGDAGARAALQARGGQAPEAAQLLSGGRAIDEREGGDAEQGRRRRRLPAPRGRRPRPQHSRQRRCTLSPIWRSWPRLPQARGRCSLPGRSSQASPPRWGLSSPCVPAATANPKQPAPASFSWGASAAWLGRRDPPTPFGHSASCWCGR